MTETPAPVATDGPLKPCPFCGGKAELCAGGFGYFGARCRECHIVMPAKSSQHAAHSAWNTRAL